MNWVIVFLVAFVLVGLWLMDIYWPMGLVVGGGSIYLYWFVALKKY